MGFRELFGRSKNETRYACPSCGSEVYELSESGAIDICYECGFKGSFVPRSFAPGEGSGPLDAQSPEGRAYIGRNGLVRRGKPRRD